MSNRWRGQRLWRVALWVLGCALFTILALEAGLRVLAPQPFIPDMNTFDKKLGKVVRGNLDTHFLLPGVFHYQIHTDGSGFRIPGAGITGARAPAVAFLGDSFTFGVGVEEEESFAGLAREHLKGRASVINAGVPGTGLTQQLAMYELKVRQLRPRVVVLATYSNDLHDCHRRRTYSLGPTGEAVFRGPGKPPPGGPRPDPLGRWLRQHSHIYTALFFGLYDPTKENLERPLEAWEHVRSGEGARLFLACLRRLLRDLRQDGAKLIITPIPHADELDKGQSLIRDLLFSGRLSAEELGSFQVIDLSPKLSAAKKGGELYFVEGHYNQRGHQAHFSAIRAELDRALSREEGEAPAHAGGAGASP